MLIYLALVRPFKNAVGATGGSGGEIGSDMRSAMRAAMGLPPEK